MSSLINEANFKNFFTYRLFKKLKDTVYPHVITVKNALIIELFDEVIFSKKASFPETLDYLVMNKGNNVTRILPVFSIKTICLYHYLIRNIEDDLVKNRIDGTFGGYRIGNSFLKKEKNELDLSALYMLTINPAAWSKEWKSYQDFVFKYYNENEFDSIVMFDIANFYDSVNLSRLEHKARLAVTSSDDKIINLLFFILKNWNYRLNKYKENYSGLPQNEVGDESRILANFYLQDYDAYIKKKCDEVGAKYLRYSDDTIIYGKGIKVVEKLLWQASKYLNKEGLNINVSKVKFFQNEEGLKNFHIYWAFDIHDCIDSKEWEEAISIFEDYKKNSYSFREFSVVKRFITITNGYYNTSFWGKYILTENFLKMCKHFDLINIYKHLKNKKKTTQLTLFKKLIINIAENSLFNLELYHILKFNNISKMFDASFDAKIEERIKLIKGSYDE